MKHKLFLICLVVVVSILLVGCGESPVSVTYETDLAVSGHIQEGGYLVIRPTGDINRTADVAEVNIGGFRLYISHDNEHGFSRSATSADSYNLGKCVDGIFISDYADKATVILAGGKSWEVPVVCEDI